MDISSSYTQFESNPNTLRKGGLILRGRTRSTRQPVHMILLVDTSGSMDNENKLASVQRSIQLMVTLLSAEDRISLVTFADDSRIVLSQVIPTPEERAAITYRVNSLTSNGSTNMSAGLLDVRSLVEQASSGRKQGVILLTDGHANVGVHSEEGLLGIVQRIQTESPGVSVTTVAYGVDHNADMLTAIAKAGGGAYNVVKDLEDVASVFGDILGGLVSVSAQKVEIQLPPGAEAHTNYHYTRDPNGTTNIYIGDVYADAELCVFFSNAPGNGAIRVKGIDMTTLDQIDSVVEPIILDSPVNIPLPLVVADYSLKTSDLLKKVSRSATTGLRDEIEVLIINIEEDDRIREHPLKPMLLEDLRRAFELAVQGGNLTQIDTVEVAQHSAFLSMARGLRTTIGSTPNRQPAALPRSPLRRRNAVPHNVHPNLNVTSPFANRLQAQYSQAMTAMSQADPQEEHDD